MTSSLRLQKMFADLYNGQPWSCINLLDIIKDLTAEQAAQHPIQNANSIWQLVHHCVGWKENVLRKLNGEIFTSPEDNYLSKPSDTSALAWQTLLKHLEKTEADWQAFLTRLDEAALNAPYAPSKGEFTVYEVIQGLLHHDNYHYGQIVMLKKLL